MPPGLLEARSGLARHTVLRGLSQLESAGWLRLEEASFKGKAIMREYLSLLVESASMARGVGLVVLHPDDLFLEVLRKKVDGLLPLRELDGGEPVIACLEAVSCAYRKQVRRRGANAKPETERPAVPVIANDSDPG